MHSAAKLNALQAKTKVSADSNAITAGSWDTSVLTAAHLVANATEVVQTALGAEDRVPGGHHLGLVPVTSLDPHPLVHILLTSVFKPWASKSGG